MANRPFDLKAALSGEPVQYRDLCTVEFLRLSKWEGKPCIQFARIGERVEHLTTDLDGKVLFCTDNGETQVFMAPRKVKKTVWVNLYRSSDCEPRPTEHQFWKDYPTDTDARLSSQAYPPWTSLIATAVPVEIEVEE